MDKLRFNSFGYKWIDGLPLGNGRIAAMVWGNEEFDRISLNHEWLWSGKFKNRRCPVGSHLLPFVRDYLKNGENFKATALAAVAFGGNGGISPLQRQMDSFRPAGSLTVYHESAQAVQRCLAMNEGVAYSTKQLNGEKLSLTAFCHAENDIFAFKWECTHKTSVRLEYDCPCDENSQISKELSSQEIILSCNNPEDISFKVLLKFITDGKVSVKNNNITIEDMTRLVVLGNIGSSHKGIESELSKSKLEGDFEQLLELQKSVFSAEYNKTSLELWDDNTQVLQKLFIEQRKARMENGENDPALVSLFARFGVYLMIAGSLKAELPLNLQGKWNYDLNPKWNSDYHLNINLQMNYWFTDSLCMDSFTKQMTDYVLSLLPKAEIAAKNLYGCRGILYPLNSDIWANVTPEAYNYSVWISGAGWLASHFYKSFKHTGDIKYLKEYAYPFFKEIAQFYEDYIEFDQDNIAQLMPSQSPENRYAGTGYFPVSMCISAAMDVQVAYDALGFAIKSARLLNIDLERADRWEKIRDSLPEFKIGSDGRLLEWDSENKIEVEKGHRHVSHLYGVYPSSLFTPEKRVKQFNAAKKSLQYRLANNSGYTGWSSAWSACLHARFLDSENVMANLKHLITKQSSATLLDLHPDFYPVEKKGKPSDQPLLFTPPQADPPMIFQIDGNLGAAAAVIEALVQLRDGIIYLLAAAAKWKNGKVKRLRVEGGHILNFVFENGKLSQLSVTLGFTGKAIFANLAEDNGDLIVKGEPNSFHVIIAAD